METISKTTRDVILEQLQENTGTHFLDSGGAYGRHWQRNQGKTWEDFVREPVTVEAYVYSHGAKPELEILGYISVAAWLDANLEYDDEMQLRYEAWVSENDPENEMYDMERMERFAEEMGGKTGWGGDSSIQYTYNCDNDLSQDIQFIEFVSEEDGQSFVLVQLHQGCDARGGMGSPKAYRLESDYFGRWSVDGYYTSTESWDESMSSNEYPARPGLKDYPVHELVWVPTLERDLEALKQTDHDTEETRELMRATAVTLERSYFEEFCEALTEDSVVVFKRRAYLVVDGEPDEIHGECTGLYN